MKEIYLLSERGTGMIYSTSFLSKEKAEQKALEMQDESQMSYWDILTLKLNEEI